MFARGNRDYGSKWCGLDGEKLIHGKILCLMGVWRNSAGSGSQKHIYLWAST
jgi:hypothetical protein